MSWPRFELVTPNYDEKFFVVFLNPFRQIPGWNLKVGHYHFLPHYFQFIIYCVPIIQCCLFTVTGSVVKEFMNKLVSLVHLTRACRSKLTMLVKRMCSYRKGEADACSSLALPCTQHCIRHIMYNVDQLLFEHCTAKFSDNTQCCVPVFDICHELPLCLEHARKRVSQNFV